MTACNFSEIMKKDATELAGETIKEPSVLSIEDQEIKRLEDIQKEGNRLTQRETRVNRTEIKKPRQRSPTKLTDRVETVRQSGRGSNQTYKRGSKKEIFEMNNQENEALTDRNEILKIWAHFNSRQYMSTHQGRNPSQRIPAKSQQKSLQS